MQRIAGGRPAHLLKFATMMGIGRVIQSTPQIAHRDPTSFPAEVLGATSPYPAVGVRESDGPWRGDVEQSFKLKVCPYIEIISHMAVKVVKFTKQSLCKGDFGQVLRS